MSIVARLLRVHDAYTNEWQPPPATQARMLDARYSGGVLAMALLRKLGRRLRGRARGLDPVAAFNGVLVYDTPAVQWGGGLQHGENVGRMLHELGIGPCDHLFEYCAGGGYLGFALLAQGHCRRLTIADLRPEAIEAVRATIAANALADRVTAYVSDALDDIPPHERWDVVVGTPPTSLPESAADDDVVCFDPGYGAQRRFYERVRGHLKPGGRVVMILVGAADRGPEPFTRMVVDAGGTVERVHHASLATGARPDQFAVVSRWD